MEIGRLFAHASSSSSEDDRAVGFREKKEDNERGPGEDQGNPESPTPGDDRYKT